MADGERNPVEIDVTPRDAIANLCQTFRYLAGNGDGPIYLGGAVLRAIADRLEAAMRRMDAEKASDPKFILRETAEAYNDGCADGLDSDSAHDMAMGVLAGLLGLAPEPGPLEDEKASPRQ